MEVNGKKIPPSLLADRLIVRLPDGLRERLRAVAQREDRSMNYIAARSIEQAVAEAEAQRAGQ